MNGIKKTKTILNNDYVFAFVKKAIVTSCSVVFVSLLSRYLGPSLKGKYITYISYENIIVIVIQWGIFKLYPNFKRTHNVDDLKNIFFSISIYKFVIMVIISTIIWKPLVGIGINKVFPYAVILNALQGECLFYALVDNIKFQNKVLIVVYSINVVSIILLYTFIKQNLTYVFIALMIRDSLAIIMCVVILKYKLVFTHQIISVTKELLRVSIYPVLASLLVELNYRVDVIFLNRMVDNHNVGLYSSGVSIAEMAWMVPDVFKEVLFNKTAEKDNVNQVTLCLRLSMIMIFLCMILTWFFGRFIIDILFGKQYAESYYVTNIIFLAIPFISIFKVLNPLYQAKGEWRYYLTTLVLSALSNIVLNYCFIQYVGMYGAAAASIISYAIAGLMLLFSFCHNYKLKISSCLLLSKNDINLLYGYLNRITVRE